MLKIVRWKLRGMPSRNCIPEKFQTQMTFSVGESTSRPNCVCTPFTLLTMSWVNEVEMDGSTDDLMASQSIKGKSFPDFEMLDARIASALRKIISSTSAGRRLCVEEQRAQRRQIAYVIYGHFQSTGAHDTAEGLSDLCSICLQDDDVQDFDARWDLFGNK